MAGCGHGCVMAVAYAPLFSRRCVRRSGTESLQTLRWREVDSKLRSLGSAGASTKPEQFQEIDKARRLGTVAILARKRKFESIPLQRTVSVSDRLELSRSRTAGFPRVGAAGLAARSGETRGHSSRSPASALISRSGDIP